MRLAKTKATIGDNDDFENSYSYNTFNELVEIAQVGINPTTLISATKNINYEYNQESQRTKTSRYENLISISDTTYNYDGIIYIMCEILGIYFLVDADSRKMEYDILLPVRINCLPFDDYGHFDKKLWYWKVFDVINASCSILIDIYEEEMLPLEQINNAIIALKKLRANIQDLEIVAFVDLLIEFLGDAKKAEKPVYFAF
jgi:hypothetical protein